MLFFLYSIYFRFVCLFVRIRKTIVVYSNSYYDSPRRIVEHMHELDPEFELIWLFSRPFEDRYCIVPPYVKKRRYSKFTLPFILGKAFCVISNFEFLKPFIKRKGQLFVQTYHGDRGPKKILHQCEGHTSFVGDEFVTDICMSGSTFGTERYREAFHYHGKITEYGLPRNDRLLSSCEDTVQIKTALGVPLDKKVLLYAPTFRDGQSYHEQLDFALLRQLLGDGYVFLERRHRVDADSKGTAAETIDVTDYPDMADILEVADVVVSDYSSVPYDFALTNKPIILAPFDQQDYTESSRGLLFPLESTGLKIANSTEEIARLLISTTAEEFARLDQECLAFFGTSETGESTDLICKTIIQRFQK